jgi:serine-type D-Ala-D-Ala carboxypeptidase (penicillin-binding protein 5/6)
MSSFLHGGRRRRRVGSRLALIAGLAALGAVGAAVYVVLSERHNGSSRASEPAFLVPASRIHSSAEASLLRQPPAPRIRLGGVDAFRMGFRKPPRAGIVFDVRTGEVLWRRQPQKVLPIASLTKVMTALLVTTRAGPNERVRITKDSLNYSGSGVGVLPKGRRVRFEALLNGLLIVSGNDAAIALADHVAGNQRRFVALMNRRARQLGLRCTHYVSPHGLEAGNRSCARDLAMLASMAARNRRIMRVTERRRQISLPFPIKGRRLVLAGHNPLYRAHYRGALGLKTGFTDEAGQCFVGLAKRGHRELGVVLLNSPNPQRHAPALLDAAFRR